MARRKFNFSPVDLSIPKPKVEPFSPESLQRQIDNASTRIQSVGGNPQQDTRNGFEKWANLPENQNLLFDTLDLLGRPGQAVKNIIDDQIVGRSNSIGDSAWRGFSGKNNVSGSDIQTHLGVDNKAANFGLGLTTDILTDPTNLLPGKVVAAPLSVTAKTLGKGANLLADTVPIAGKLKDGLGNAFKYQYGWENTLNGTKDDTLKNMFNQTNNDIRFRTEEAMKNVADIAKTTGVKAGEDVGRVMESNVPVYGPRPFRQMPNDPTVSQAANNLMQSNDTIRQWAQDSGVDVGELQGYMAHILSAEERKVRPKNIAVDRGASGLNNPDKKILNSRTLQGSAEDINQQIGRKFFEPNAYFATAIGQKRLIEFASATKFRREVLSNPDFAAQYQKGMMVPKDAHLIDTNNYTFLKDPAGTLPDEVGGKYIVSKGAKEALDRYQKLTTDEGVQSFLKAFDSVQSTWKRMALFSVPYHIRNAVGAVFNNWVGGMSGLDLAKYNTIATKEVAQAVGGKESAMFREYRQQGLGSTNLSQVEFAKHGQDPEQAIQKTITERSRSPLGQVATRLNPLRAFETSRELGDTIDQTNRFALYKWARDNGMTPEQAAAKVKQVQFDYSALTTTEREIMTRFFPFYRWMRNNIPFQVQQFIADPRKYNNANKVRTNAQDTFGINENNTPDWMKQNFAFAVSGDGNQGKFLSLNLPLADLTKLSSPLKTAADSMTPAVKLPLELATNFNTFLGKPIQKFQGETKQFAGVDVPAKLGYFLDQATGQVGKGLSGFMNDPSQASQDTKYRTPSLGISSMFKDYDLQKATKYQLMDKLKKLQDQINYIEQQTGKQVPTLAELKKAGLR